MVDVIEVRLRMKGRCEGQKEGEGQGVEVKEVRKADRHSGQEML